MVSPSVQKILLAMPTFNNAGTVLDLMSQLSKIDLPLLIIDDGSTVSIPALVPTDLNRKFSVLRHDTNKGKGAALRSAFHWARTHHYTHVITVDADGQHFVKDVVKMAEASRAQPDTLIIGRRDMDSPAAGLVPQSSRFGRDFSDFWIAVETGKRVSDSQSGLRCYPVANLPDTTCWSVRYDFEVEIVTRWLWRGGKTKSIDIDVSYAENRVSSFKPLLDNIRISWLHTKLCTARLFGAGVWFNKNLPANKEVSGAAFLGRILAIFGPNFCYALLPLVSVFYWAISHKQRRCLIDFYRHLGITGLSAYWHTYRNFLSFAFSIVDRTAFAAGLINPKVASIQQTFSPDDSGWILLGAHFGDWSFAGANFYDKHGRKVLVAINQKINPQLQSLVQNAFAGRLTFLDLSADRLATILTCKDVLEQGGYVCFMADRLSKNDRDVFRVQFLGEYIHLSKNMFRMSKVFRRPVKFFNCTRTSNGKDANYHLIGTNIWDGKEDINEEEMANRYVKTMEEAVKTSPQNWFNFYDYWSHERANSTSLLNSLSTTESNHKEQNDQHQLEAHA
jgi:predicted LPLAT superfamily acyltransferase